MALRRPDSEALRRTTGYAVPIRSRSTTVAWTDGRQAHEQGPVETGDPRSPNRRVRQLRVEPAAALSRWTDESAGPLNATMLPLDWHPCQTTQLGAEE